METSLKVEERENLAPVALALALALAAAAATEAPATAQPPDGALETSAEC